ncbi:NAD(+)/NADH kinase [bacterium]|nr:NAD(+)/NADH kinase [bacterium]
MKSNEISKVFLFFRNDGKRVSEQAEIRDFIIEECGKRGGSVTGDVQDIDPGTLAVAVGGDGTFLSCAAIAFAHRIPIAGINVGHLGFLAEINPDERELISSVLRGNFDVRERMIMDVSVFRSEAEIFRFTALNEVTIHRDMRNPMLLLGIEYDSEEMPFWKGDGLIVATPTGSTAYNLSCNGPIIYPTDAAFVINAISPHALTHRPIVVPAEGEIRVTAKECVKGVLTCDGNNTIEVFENDVVVIRKNPVPLETVINPKRNFFNILSERLHLGKRL